MPFSIDCILDSIRDEHYNSPNPLKTSLKYPCSICNKPVLKNQCAIECDSCELWVHNKCNGTSSDEYETIKTLGELAAWECLKCKTRLLCNNLPFMFQDNLDIENLNHSDSMSFFDMLPQLKVRSEILSNEYNSNDIDQNITDYIDCKYYTVQDFKKLSLEKTLNIYHANVNGLDSHFDNLHEFLSNEQTPKFDIINITETSQKIGENFKTNVMIEGYDFYCTETKSAKGGTAIYIKNNYDSFERDDLKILNDDFETVWIEIKNKNNKNIICGCVYRHPRYDMTGFLKYMEKTLDMLNKENKEIYISGDFNTDFLKINNNVSYQEFYNLVTSNGFLPQIIQPTRVTEFSSTIIIDNIFTNTFRSGTISGNLLLCISEHFSQFLIIDKNDISLKNINIYARNYKSFNTQAFRNDISLLNWSNDSNDVNELYTDFITKLETCVDLHAPIKKLNRKRLS